MRDTNSLESFSRPATILFVAPQTPLSTALARSSQEAVKGGSKLKDFAFFVCRSKYIPKTSSFGPLDLEQLPPQCFAPLNSQGEAILPHDKPTVACAMVTDALPVRGDSPDGPSEPSQSMDTDSLSTPKTATAAKRRSIKDEPSRPPAQEPAPETRPTLPPPPPLPPVAPPDPNVSAMVERLGVPLDPRRFDLFRSVDSRFPSKMELDPSMRPTESRVGEDYQTPATDPPTDQTLLPPRSMWSPLIVPTDVAGPFLQAVRRLTLHLHVGTRGGAPHPDRGDRIFPCVVISVVGLPVIGRTEAQMAGAASAEQVDVVRPGLPCDRYTKGSLPAPSDCAGGISIHSPASSPGARLVNSVGLAKSSVVVLFADKDIPTSVPAEQFVLNSQFSTVPDELALSLLMDAGGDPATALSMVWELHLDELRARRVTLTKGGESNASLLLERASLDGKGPTKSQNVPTELALSVSLGSSADAAAHVTVNEKPHGELGKLSVPSCVRLYQRIVAALRVLPPHWSSVQGLQYAYGMNRFGKQFHQIAWCVQGKSARQVCELYYLLKFSRCAAQAPDSDALDAALAAGRERLNKVFPVQLQSAKRAKLATATSPPSPETVDADAVAEEAAFGSPLVMNFRHVGPEDMSSSDDSEDSASVPEQSVPSSDQTSQPPRRQQPRRNARMATDPASCCSNWCSFCKDTRPSVILCTKTTCSQAMCEKCFRSKAASLKHTASGSWRLAKMNKWWLCFDCCPPIPSRDELAIAQTSIDAVSQRALYLAKADPSSLDMSQWKDSDRDLLEFGQQLLSLQSRRSTSDSTAQSLSIISIAATRGKRRGKAPVRYADEQHMETLQRRTRTASGEEISMRALKRERDSNGSAAPSASARWAPHISPLPVFRSGMPPPYGYPPSAFVPPSAMWHFSHPSMAGYPSAPWGMYAGPSPHASSSYSVPTSQGAPPSSSYSLPAPYGSSYPATHGSPYAAATPHAASYPYPYLAGGRAPPTPVAASVAPTASDFLARVQAYFRHAPAYYSEVIRLLENFKVKSIGPEVLVHRLIALLADAPNALLTELAMFVPPTLRHLVSDHMSVRVRRP
jgi:hypothetical protein